MMEIELDADSYSPGGAVKVTVRRSGKKVKVRAVEVELACYARKKVKTSRTMDKYDYDREHELGIVKSTHITTEESEESEKRSSQRKSFDGGEFESVSFEMEFTLPKDAKPTSREFGHDNAIYVWKVTAKLDVPFGIDENAQKEIFVSGL